MPDTSVSQSYAGIEPKPTRDFGRRADMQEIIFDFEACVSAWKNGGKTDSGCD